jgi:hypothetical protein
MAGHHRYSDGKTGAKAFSHADSSPRLQSRPANGGQRKARFPSDEERRGEAFSISNWPLEINKTDSREKDTV